MGEKSDLIKSLLLKSNTNPNPDHNMPLELNLYFSNLDLDCFPCRLCQPRKFAEANLKLFYAWGAVAAVEAGGKSKKFGGKIEV